MPCRELTSKKLQESHDRHHLAAMDPQSMFSFMVKGDGG